MLEPQLKANRKFLLLSIFGIAMGFLEAIVVVYLRQLFYPNGFDFPLAIFPEWILDVEWLREIATIVMLLTIATIAGKNFNQRFSFFLYTFAIWDIFYYIALKMILNWPSSLLTFDILFLIPVAWIGPVLAPLICSITMIILSIEIVFLEEKGFKIKIKFLDWLLILSGSLIIFLTFIWDYSKIIIFGGYLSNFFSLFDNEKFIRTISEYKPEHFNWLAFLMGEVLILLSMVFIFKKRKATL
jgi:hypothetical protein